MAEGSLKKLLGTPVKLKFKGETYELSPLEFDDLGKMEQWLQDRPLRVVEGQLERNPDSYSPALREKLLYEAFKEGQRTTVQDTDAVREAFGSVEGARQVMYLLLQKKHPDITEETAAGIVRTRNLEEMQTLMDSVSGLKEVLSGESSAGAEAQEAT